MAEGEPNRRTRKKIQTRQAIRHIALDLFMAHGYTRVTVEQISEAADVSAMTFYRHFRNKEGVIFSVAISERLQAALAGFAEAHDAAALDATLTLLFDDASQWCPDLGRRLQLIAATPELTNAFWSYSTTWVNALYSALPATLEDRVLARCTVGAAMECALAWATGSQDPTPHALRQSLHDVLNRILVARKATAGHNPTSEDREQHQRIAKTGQ